jgi:hypothetical protein
MFRIEAFLAYTFSVCKKATMSNQIIFSSKNQFGYKTRGILGTPTKRQVSKRQVSKRLKRQVYKTSGLQNVRSSKRPVAKKHPYIFCTCGWWKSAGSVAAMFLTFCKPDVLKPDVLKPDVLKPDVLKPDVLWVYRILC